MVSWPCPSAPSLLLSLGAGAVSAGAVSAGAARWPLAGFAWLPGSPTGGHHLKRRKIRTHELRENVSLFGPAVRR